MEGFVQKNDGIWMYVLSSINEFLILVHMEYIRLTNFTNQALGTIREKNKGLIRLSTFPIEEAQVLMTSKEWTR